LICAELAGRPPLYVASIALIAICTFVVPIIGVVLAIFYLASIRPRVRSGQSF